MKLSVIIPAYNEANKIGKTVLRLASYLSKQPYQHEIIAVDDGSQDQTHFILQELTKGLPVLRIIRNETNHGKGCAVKCGVMAAKGDVIFFTDADLSTPPHEIAKFSKIFESKNIDILIGSRHVKGARILIPQPCHRKLMGRVFNLIVKMLTPLRFQDTQCGFKGFRREAARKIFSTVKENGFNFDVEVLLRAKKFGFTVNEIPVTWVNHEQSKINAFKDSLQMFGGLIRLSRTYQSW